ATASCCNSGSSVWVATTIVVTTKVAATIAINTLFDFMETIVEGTIIKVKPRKFSKSRGSQIY
ncbi:MAG TPA: hypothetical protein VKA95_00065, partial [Nitrososphaeraceae archaeon]|nr:hypothetical protein [Nitrososphaeraceae archaeon]